MLVREARADEVLKEDRLLPVCREELLKLSEVLKEGQAAAHLGVEDEVLS